MNFLDLLKHRRSIRQYKEEAVSKEALEAIVEAGLLSPSGRNIRPWELIVVQKKETLEKCLSAAWVLQKCWQARLLRSL